MKKILALFALTAACVPAFAADSFPIRIVVLHASGGNVDISADIQ